jgi:5'-3' exonuclease
MGVKDLWQLLAPTGRRVSIETLEGKILAIDMSIWITQFIKAMRDEEGNMVKNAHIIGTLRRILKLLFHRIRPVFVFDGQAPILKLRVVRNRRRNHEKQVYRENFFPSQLMNFTT